MDEVTDTDRLDWIAESPIDRLEDIRFRVVNTGCGVREAIDEAMREANED